MIALSLALATFGAFSIQVTQSSAIYSSIITSHSSNYGEYSVHLAGQPIEKELGFRISVSCPTDDNSEVTLTYDFMPNSSYNGFNISYSQEDSANLYLSDLTIKLYDFNLTNIYTSQLHQPYYFLNNVVTDGELDMYSAVSNYSYYSFVVSFRNLPSSIVDAFNAEGYQDGYKDGYTNGVYEGITIGQNSGEGYAQGYESGYTQGVNDGYNQGYDDATTGHYTFFSLFGAIADTPIMFLRQLLGFEVFGVQAISILMSMLTGCIVLYLVRKIIL